ncbi:hypothetical protein CCP3SC15_450005 [Gammaproteobacteria bacterium]
MRDSNLVFHDGTNFTATVTPASTTRSGGSAVLDVGKSGERGLWVQLALTAVVVGSGTPTIDCKVQYSDSATFASGVEDGPAFPQLVEGTALNYRRCLLCQSKRRYWRVLMTKGGSTLTSETILLHIVSGPNADSVA